MVPLGLLNTPKTKLLYYTSRYRHLNRLAPKAKVLAPLNLARFRWSRFWVFCRGVDVLGSGRVNLLFPELEKLFGVRQSTIYDWLSSGRAAGVFRCWVTRGDLVQVFLGSKFSICEKLGVEDWGASVEIELDQCFLSVGKFRALITQAQTDVDQRASYWAAYHGLKDQTTSREFRHKLQFLKTPLQLFLLWWAMRSDVTCFNSDNLLLCRYFLLNSRIPVGASQEGIAQNAGITSRTVRRHLEPVERCQLAITISEAEYEAERFYQSEGDGNPNTFMFRFGGSCFLAGCNVYDLEFKLRRQLYQKYKFYLWKQKRRGGEASISLSYTSFRQMYILQNLPKLDKPPGQPEKRKEG